MQASDAHIHVGYFLRQGSDEPFYYSPRRMTSLLKRSGVTEFIFSSTDCFAGVALEDIHCEAQEVRRLAGAAAHPFFWVSEDALRHDPELRTLPPWYEGLKLHGGEYRWLEHPDEFRHILAIARQRRYAVQIHTDSAEQSVLNYLPFCLEAPEVHFDLAHCKSVQDVATAARQGSNLWFDIAFSSPGTVQALLEAGVPEKRILFGSDVPVQQRYNARLSLTDYLRKRIAMVHSEKIRNNNFQDFLSR